MPPSVEGQEEVFRDYWLRNEHTTHQNSHAVRTKWASGHCVDTHSDHDASRCEESRCREELLSPQRASERCIVHGNPEVFDMK